MSPNPGTLSNVSLPEMPMCDIPQDDNEGPVCKSCWLQKWRTSWDLRLDDRQWVVSFAELKDAATKDCQDCAFILDAVLTYIMPKTELPWTKITVRPFPLERRLYIRIKPSPRGSESYIELEVLRFADRWPLGSKSASAGEPRRTIWDVATQPPFVEVLSKETHVTLKEWIEQCSKEHVSCSRPEVTLLPKRVLQIVSDTVFLRDTQGQKGKYACLSHCWGKKGPRLKLTGDTMHQLYDGMARVDLPKTFRDAIRVCNSLRISYLWIDALCIKQDDLGDWQETAAQMASIFENAFVTLAATFAKNSDGGLFPGDQDLSPKRLSSHSKVYVRARKKTSRLPLTYKDSSLKDSPLLLRGWVYQERRLSRRFVHFAQHQMIWQCKSHLQSEDKDINTFWENYAPQDAKAIHARPFGHWSGDAVADWKKTVSEYQGLQLTYESDRLPAIAALAERMLQQRNGQDNYIAGMWRNTILTDLCWYHFGQNYPRPESTIPSWSWASIKGVVMWADTTPLPLVNVSDLQYTPVGPANIGAVVNASLVLTGRVVEGRFVVQPRTAPYYTVPCGVTMAIAGDRKYSTIKVTHFYPDFSFAQTSQPVTPGDPLTGIIIYRERLLWTGLMLRAKDSNDMEYERIGLFSIQYQDYRKNLGTSMSEEETGFLEDYVASLPLRQLKIV